MKPMMLKRDFSPYVFLLCGKLQSYIILPCLFWIFPKLRLNYYDDDNNNVDDDDVDKDGDFFLKQHFHRYATKDLKTIVKIDCESSMPHFIV